MLLNRQANEERDEHIDLTPMVDVVFQLMTFMLFSIQLTGGEMSVPAAKHGVGVDDTSSTLVWMLKPEEAGGEARMVVGDAPDGPPMNMDAVKKAIADGVREGRLNVILQADGDVTHGDVLKAAAAVTEIDNIVLRIGVQEPE